MSSLENLQRAERLVVKTVLITVAALIIGFGALTWAALEWSGVAIIETRAPDGSVRHTHVWFVEHEGEIWLEAGSPDNPWYVDVMLNPSIMLDDGRSRRAYLARPVAAPNAHRQIRSLIQAKYGARDRWIGRLVDTSESKAVRLEPVAPTQSPGPTQ